MTERTQSQRGISSLTLHLLAMAFMLCDHLWATVVPGNMWMTQVGRLAFPIFAFLAAEGFAQTHDLKRYRRRLLLFALISEVPFNLMMAAGPIYPFHQNVMWTLLIALYCLEWIEKAKTLQKPWQQWLGILAVAVAGWLLGTVTLVDYGGAGVLTVLLFSLLRGESWPRRLGQLAGLVWINCFLIGGQLLPVTLGGLAFEFPEQGLAVAALVPIWLYHGRQGPHNRAIQLFCYAFYPLHMLFLSLPALL